MTGAQLCDLCGAEEAHGKQFKLSVKAKNTGMGGGVFLSVDVLCNECETAIAETIAARTARKPMEQPQLF